MSSQEEAPPSLKRFQDLLRQLFQIEAADLDFGIYRILNYKRERVEEFINKRLPQIVNKAFQDYAKAEGMAQYQVTEDLKIRVYNDLYTFFSRYYEDGDFIAKRRYGRRETYAIPYNGEEVVLHWATKDQYYIKTGERFKNYRFKVKISTKDEDLTKVKNSTGVENATEVQEYTIAFELRSATTAQNNNKGDKCYFVLASDKPDQKTKTITVFFEYRPLTDAEKKEYGKTEQQKPQDKLNKKAEEAILKWLQDLASKKPENSEERKELEALKAQLEKPEAENGKSQSEKSKAANGKSLLMKHLTRFTRRNTSDFFIHKNLRRFLQEELEFFIKSQCLLLDELLAQEGNLTHQHILRARVVRKIGYKIIDFLAQVEDFQKRLFEKKKFVIRTEYCITMDRMPEELWDEVLQNKDQLAEWRQLYGVDPQPTRDFLREHPYLVVDTCHFSEDFKWRLLGCFDDLDEALDGLLIKSENFQALNLLMERYRGQVKCIYIDPPYNTGTDEFVYKDEYQTSSWLSFLRDRIMLAHGLLAEEGIFFSSIDDNEEARLHILLEYIFGASNVLPTLAVRRRKSQPNLRKGVSPVHDYLKIACRDYVAMPRLSYVPEEFGIGKFSNPDNDPRGPWTTGPCSNRGGSRYKIVTPAGVEYEDEWRFTEETYRKLLEEGRIYFPESGRGKPRYKIYLSEKKEQGVVPSTWWDDVGDTQSSHRLLEELFGQRPFENPKPLELLGRIVDMSTLANNVEYVLDFFAGSGTTAHAVINLNREDGGRRKYILVEMGDYFETVLLKRIKKVVYSDKWKDGKPQKGKGISHFFKYLYLEQYEDTLNNLDLTTRKQEGQLAWERFGDEYLLRYMLDFETQGSPPLLNLEKLKDPFAYKLKVQEGDEMREPVVDLVETFNYLLGIHVKKMRQCRYNERLYRAVLGEKDGKRIVIVWRPLKGLNGDPGDVRRDQGSSGDPGDAHQDKDSKSDTPALRRDRKFIECIVLPALLGKGKKPDRLLVNGICYVPEAEPIEPEFKRLMWRENQDGWEV